MTRIDGEIVENGVAVKDGVNGQVEEAPEIVNIAHAYDTMLVFHAADTLAHRLTSFLFLTASFSTLVPNILTLSSAA